MAETTDFDYKCLYVKGIPHTTTAKELKPMFEAAGDVNIVKKVSPATAIVSYKQEGDARKAIERLDGSNVHGSIIHVEFKKKKSDNPNPRNRGVARPNQARPQNSYVAAEVSEKLDVDLCKLRYMHGFHKIKNTLNNLPAKVTIDLHSASLSIVGQEHQVPDSIREIENLASSFVVVTASLTDVFRQCFRSVRPAEIVEKFKSSRIFAGWDLSESQLRICSNCSQNAELALELIKDIVVESEYPVDGELSLPKRSLVAGSEWVHFRDHLKSDDTMHSLEIQYDSAAKKIRYALRSSGNIHAVVQALDQFFKHLNVQEQQVQFDKTVAQLILKKKKYVLKSCSEDGVEFDFDELSTSNSCTIRSQSSKLLDSAVHKLKHLAANQRKKNTSFSKSSHVAWITSALGQEKIDDFNSLCHTTTDMSIKRVETKASKALPAAASEVSASASSRLAGKLKVVKGDIANIEADGLISCDGVVASAIEKRMNGGRLKPGLQVVDKHINGEWSKVYVYHVQSIPLDSSEDAIAQLRRKVKHAYQHLQAHKAKVIAFPAIGTGGRGYPPAKVASTIVGVTAKYFDINSTQKVYFVVHPQADDVIHKAFEKELLERIPRPRPLPRVVETTTTRELTVTFIGLQTKDVTAATERLEKELKHIMMTQSWDLPSEKSAIMKLDRLEAINIRSEAKERNVDVDVDVSTGTIKLEGLKDDIAAVRDYVNSILGSNASSTNAFPEHWDKAALAKGHHEVKLDPHSFEYSKVLCKFFDSCTTAGIQVTEITRIQNEHLYTQYQAQKSKVKKELVGDPSVEVEYELWHGTSAEGVKQICANEFNRSYAGAHGIAYGQGSYFSISTEYSMKYSEGQENRYMILAKVATGRYRLGNSDSTRKNLQAGYHSTVDRQLQPSIFVVYHDAAAYPEYVIQFRKETVAARAVPDTARRVPRQQAHVDDALARYFANYRLQN